jgi:hypothetical protein
MDGKGKADDSAARERARLLKMDEDNLLKSTQAKIDADDAFYKFQGEMRDKDAEEAQAAARPGRQESARGDRGEAGRRRPLLHRARRHYDEMAKQTKKTKGFMEDLGFTMISSFENAIVSGKKFGDVLQSLLKDIEKVILRKGVLDPLGNAAGDWFKGVFRTTKGARRSSPARGLLAALSTRAAATWWVRTVLRFSRLGLAARSYRTRNSAAGL